MFAICHGLFGLVLRVIGRLCSVILVLISIFCTSFRMFSKDLRWSFFKD